MVSDLNLMWETALSSPLFSLLSSVPTGIAESVIDYMLPLPDSFHFISDTA